jgi:transcriptional regulator with XRE-family HTH domain
MRKKIMNNLKNLREKENITQEQLSKETNIPIGTLRDWEQKNYPKQIQYLIKLKEKLNCTFEELLQEIKQQEEKN